MPRQPKLDKKARVYGSRWVRRDTPDGGKTLEEVPLTWDDLFDPHEGDHVINSTVHGQTLSNLATQLESVFALRDRRDVLVCMDVLMLWKDPAIRRVTPDVAVIPKVANPKLYRTSFNVKKEKTCPVFVLEVTSETTKEVDREDKPAIYEQAGVVEHFLLDDQKKGKWKLSGKRRDEKTQDYLDVKPDRQGRYLAKTLDVYFRIAPGDQDLILEDALTGEEIRKLPAEVLARRQAERKAAEEAEARLQEVAAREAAERKTAEEAEAREAAERKTAEETAARLQETEAREAAERKAAEEEEAREAAERKVDEKETAREAAERKVDALLAEIERLKSGE